MRRECGNGTDEKVYEFAILFARMWGIAETLEPLPNRGAEEVRDKVTAWAAEYIDSRKDNYVKFFTEKIREEFSLESSRNFHELSQKGNCD